MGRPGRPRQISWGEGQGGWWRSLPHFVSGLAWAVEGGRSEWRSREGEGLKRTDGGGGSDRSSGSAGAILRK